MREVTQTVTYTEDIKVVEHIQDRETVRITVGSPVSTPAPIQVYDIKEADYTELMSANPTWAPGKPANTFKLNDLWYFIDLIRGRNDS